MIKKTFAILLLAASLGACGQGSVMEEIEKQEKISAAAAEKALEKANAFLTENAAKPGVITTQSGLQYQVIRKGDQTKPSPGPNDVAVVHYEGRLVDGKIFDSSYARNEPATFEVGGVIPGWTEALQLMHPGDEYRLTISPRLGYGPQDKGAIPPNSVLVFKVELLGFQTPNGAVYRADQPGGGAKPAPAPAKPAGSDKPAAKAKPAPAKPAPKPDDEDRPIRFD